MSENNILVGCCGWPLARDKYFREFPVVELQSTFYQPPSAALAGSWRAGAPPAFAFTLKAWQLVTHPASSPTYRRLRKPVEPAARDRYGHFRPTGEVWNAWIETLAVARAVRAAVVVFQCPPRFAPTAENKANLEGFLRRIERDDWLVAWEPRGSWQPGEIRELCRRLDLVHCVDPFSAEPVHGHSAYFRLHGRGGYRYRYSDQELLELRRVCRRHTAAGRSPIYVMFNNVYMLEDALRFRNLMGVPGLVPVDAPSQA